MSTYQIVRFFFDKPREVIETGLTKEEAISYCKDPETSSRTASPETIAAVGHDTWFDGFEEEEE